MRREDLPKPGTGSRTKAQPGQVYWIEDSGESFIAVVVAAGGTGNDLMSVYLYRWPGDPPGDLRTIDPSKRALVSTIWKASRSRGRWTLLGTIDPFDTERWPIEPMRNIRNELVIPHPTDPGSILEERVADPAVLHNLSLYGFGTGITMLIELRRAENPDIEFIKGTATPKPA